jgi:hypothetical protein
MTKLMQILMENDIDWHERNWSANYAWMKVLSTTGPKEKKKREDWKRS